MPDDQTPPPRTHFTQLKMITEVRSMDYQTTTHFVLQLFVSLFLSLDHDLSPPPMNNTFLTTNVIYLLVVSIALYLSLWLFSVTAFSILSLR